MFATLLRRQKLLREKLEYPSGTATALLIAVLHGAGRDQKLSNLDREPLEDEREGLLYSRGNDNDAPVLHHESDATRQSEEAPSSVGSAPRTFQGNLHGSHIQVMLAALAISGLFVRLTSPL